MSHLYPWTAARYTGASRESRLQRRRRLWSWRDGAIDLEVTDGSGRALTPDDLDWEGCDRPPGRPAESGARSGAILVRVTDAERATLAEAAERAGEALSTWVRDVALRATK